MDTIATLAGGPPLSWALQAVRVHGAPRAATLAARPPHVAIQCACGVVAHPDALAAMGHSACVAVTELRCTCGEPFGLNVAALEAHTQRAHDRRATDDERTPK